MESFSLLKYWRGGGGGGGASASAAADFAFSSTSSAATATVVTAVARNQAETDEDEDDDDGPFFDLEFAVPDEDEGRKQGGDGDGDGDGRNCDDGSEEENDEDEEEEEEEDGDSDGEREFDFTLSSGSTNEHSDANLTFSPSDDLFFKGKLVPVEPSSNGGSEPNSKPQLRVTLLKSAAKFRVFMSGLKKSKSNGEKKTEADGSVGEPTKGETTELTPENPPEKNENQSDKCQNQTKSKLFAVKLKVEEVPIMSLFTRDNSSRGSAGTTTTTNNNNNKAQKQSSDELTSEETRFSKDVIMQKYLKMVKPLYIRVSRRYGEKFRLSGQLILGAARAKSGALPSIAAPPTSPPVEKAVTDTELVEVQAQTTTINTKGRNMPAKLRVVCKHLGKSRSASSAVAAAPPGQAPSRRDDSLLQQQDGIQSAILHCKRSFNASRDSESSLLSLREKPSDFTEKAIG